MNELIARKIEFHDDRAELVEQALTEPGENQVLIRTRVSLISPGTETAALKRVWDDPVFRANPGYALAGEIILAGPNSAGLAPGDRVIALMNHASLSLASADPWTTLKIPDSLSYAEATFLPLASVALHAIRRARIELGETFLIIGMGLIGQIAVSLAKMQGAHQVIAMDLMEKRLEIARSRGADITINPTYEDPQQKVFAATRGEGAPVILDASGNTRVIPKAFRLAAIGGRIVCVGIINENVTFNFYKEFMQRELSLIAASQPRCPTTQNIYWRWTQQANRQFLLDLMASGKLDVSGLISDRLDAGQAPQAYERLCQGEAESMGILLEWNRSDVDRSSLAKE